MTEFMYLTIKFLVWLHCKPTLQLILFSKAAEWSFLSNIKTYLLGIDFARIKRYHLYCSQAYMFSFQSIYLFVSLSMIFTSFWSHYEKAYPSNHILGLYLVLFWPYIQIGLRNLFSVSRDLDSCLTLLSHQVS